jgi:hypothetical protein
MGGKSGPDYGDLAVQQGEVNEGVVRDQTYANRPTQYTPWGATTWESNLYTDPGSGDETTRWTQTESLTPELQEILNKQIALQGGRTDIAGGLTERMQDEFGNAMDYGGMNPLSETPQAQYTMPESYEGIAGIGDPTAMRQRAEDAYYNKADSRLGPQFQAQQDQLELKLRNQGIGPEDAAWQAQMGALGNQRTDAYGQAQYDATRAGLGEQAQAFGQGMGMRQQGVGEANSQFQQAMGSNAQNYGMNTQGANYGNQIRQQQLTEAMQQRGFGLNEINALLSGQQVGTPQMPNFSQATAATPAPIYQAGVDQGNYNAASNPMNAVGDIAGTALGGYIGAGGQFGLGGSPNTGAAPPVNS